MIAAKGAALITALLILGILFAVMLADIVGRIALQVWGFIGCAVGLFLASLSGFFADGEQLLLIFAGFMLFNFMTNLGPNAQTYLLAGEVFPTAIRGKGAGFAAAFAKIGAVATAFLFPILLDSIGTQSLLYCLIVTSLLGAAITWLFRIETTGVSLENLHEREPHDRRNLGERATGREELMIELANPALSVPRGHARRCAIGLLELGLVAGQPSFARAGDVTLAETGSTLIDPLFKVWAADYTKTHSGVTISPAATNSVAGVEQAISGAVQIGASDAYMSDGEVEQNPLIINVPMAISAQTVNYNIPGLNRQNLKLSGPVLAGIYTGKIRAWDDSAIAALNPGVEPPAQRHRSRSTAATLPATPSFSPNI